MLNTQSITQLTTDRADLYAFRISGEVNRDDMEQMAEVMNAAFDAHDDKIDMLMIFDPYKGSETGASLSWEAVKSRFKAITNVNRYAVVGAPDKANKMIDFMDQLMPVKAETFANEPDAWRALQRQTSAAA
ncbi:STAS/SEC14 domain-containing protein [uncultured Tateyamaria sp.]|uniref:STAS/SEC14 domain-containing protein n=1 Tax=uncultured Tateyamaria sp. TaxID=455651 RepID=UPI00261A9C54|nr:STAS/SEC14 domain-containing protein [uncultured Tateyamaria sp.]